MCTFAACFKLTRPSFLKKSLAMIFVCNLSACKGACCIDGEAGAPLEESELSILESIYPSVKPYLRPEGLTAIEAQGVYIKGVDGDWETPLIDGADCAYVIFDNKGVALCAIEKAYNEGKIDWKKPISCHLYPVRVKQYSDFSAVNYHRWYICDNACSLGKELTVPVYKFVKEALIRKFGNQWYEELEEVAKAMKEQN